MPALKLYFLGELKVVRDGQVLKLPPSKKTRALLAFLALNKRAYRREQLCELLWEIPDDPRGSLRWSLSKLRRLVDDDAVTRIIADRNQVSFDAVDVEIDVNDLHALAKKLNKEGVEAVSTDELVKAASQLDGHFLDGLDLSNFHDFYTWCIAAREQTARFQARILQALIQRFETQPEKSLTYTRSLVSLTPYDESARAMLIKQLVVLGRSQEAEQQYRQGIRLLEEIEVEDSGLLFNAWRGKPGGRSPRAESTTAQSSDAQLSNKPSQVGVPTGISRNDSPLVGRDEEVKLLTKVFAQASQNNEAQCVILRGEPGIGKSRLLESIVTLAHEAQACLLYAEAFETEVIRPFALWRDAIRRSPSVAQSSTLSDLLSGDDRISRDRLFTGLSDLISQQVTTEPQRPVVVVFDDVQWCDESSAAALHYIVRMNRHQPLFVIAAARETELRDNNGMLKAVRGLRRDGLLQELKLAPLTETALQELITLHAPDVNVERLSHECAGNPLLAIELARAETAGDSGESLSELIQERISRFDVDTVETLLWASVLAPQIDVTSLERVTGLDRMALNSALEVAERQGILKPTDRGFSFLHHLIAKSIYGDISPTRRQVMHRRVAEMLEVETALDLKLASDLAYHASKSSDPALAARASVFAGRLCLRFFANEDALNLARQGLQYAEQLSDADRVCLTLDLSEIQLTAAPLENWQAAATNYVNLAEQALDHGALPYARLGYQMASYVRWMNGQWSDAQRDSLQAERVTRGGSDKDHILGMAEAAKCLALLERNLSQADAMLMEASSLAERKQIHSPAIHVASGILRYYENNLDESEELLQEARLNYKSLGDRINEYQANEYLVMIDIERGRFESAQQCSQQLLRIGEKLRDGSEEPFARALLALCKYALTHNDESLAGPLGDLRDVDAKHRLAYTLTRAALLDIQQGKVDTAIERATEALGYTEILDRPSEKMLAHVALAQANQQKKDIAAFDTSVAAITALDQPTIAKWARDRAAPFTTTDV